MIEKGVSHIAYFRLDGGSSKLYTQEYVDEKDEEIKRLKEEYVILQNASDEVEEEKDKEIKRLNSIIKEVRECINHYAIENEDYSKIYNDEEKELLEILDKEKK